MQINVLKPFRFSYFADPSDRIATEQAFSIGEHEIPDGHPMLNHPWIREHYADGRIETPAQAGARQKEAERLKREREALEAQQMAAAQAAFDKRVKAHEKGAAVNQEALERELNTPVGELRARGQMSSTPGVAAAGPDIHRPVSELRAEQGLEKPATVARPRP